MSMNQMGSFDWSNSPTVTNTSSSWSNQQHEIVHQLRPGLDSGTHSVSNCKKLPYHEAARPGPGTCWKQAIQEDMTYTRNGLMANNFDIAGQQKSTVNGLQEKNAGTSTNTDSLDSLDCLLSATNSYTDTSVEDDGISITFPENAWNLISNVNTVSSGSSASEVSSVKQKESKHCHADEFKETFLQTPKDQCANQPSSSGAKHYSRKRSRTQNELKKSPSKSRKRRSAYKQPNSASIDFQQPLPEPDSEAMTQMKEMIYQAAAFRLVNLDMVEVVEKPKRRNIKISRDPTNCCCKAKERKNK